MALDLRQLIPDVVRREELVKDVAGLDTSGWEIPVVIFKGFDCIILLIADHT